MQWQAFNNIACTGFKKVNSEENPKKQKVDETSEKQTASGNHKDLTCASVIMGSQVMYECSTC